MRMVRCPKLCSDLVAELCLGGTSKGIPETEFTAVLTKAWLLHPPCKFCPLHHGQAPEMFVESRAWPQNGLYVPVHTYLCTYVGMCTCVRMPVFLRVFPLVCLSIFAHVCGSQGVRVYTPAQCVS